MGFSFRKSINLGGGMRLNLSKSGVGFSVGTKGARITKKAGGGVRTTISVPNTGIRYTKETSKKNDVKSQKQIEQESLARTMRNPKYYWDVMNFKGFKQKKIYLACIDLCNNVKDNIQSSFSLSELVSVVDGYDDSFTVTSNDLCSLYDDGFLVRESHGVYALNIDLILDAYERFNNK